jgi:hypothetical protein
MSRKTEKVVWHPNAILFSRVLREGVFQQPQAITPATRPPSVGGPAALTPRSNPLPFSTAAVHTFSAGISGYIACAKGA